MNDVPQQKVYFETDRVFCRDMMREDIDQRCEWKRFDNPLLSYYNIVLPEGSLRDKLFNKWKTMKRFWFSCVFRNSDILAAMVSLRDIRKIRKSTRLGIVVNPEHVNKGLGTEIVNGLMKYYFTDMKYRTLYLDVARFNTRARRCYEKCGFKPFDMFWREYDGSYTVTGLPEFRQFRKCFSYRHNRLFVQFDDMKMTREMWRNITNDELRMTSYEEGVVSNVSDTGAEGIR